MRSAAPHRIAYVIGELGKGGAEYQLHELLRHLDRERFEPRVFVLTEGGWWAEPIRRLGVRVDVIPRRRSADLSRVRRLRAALRAFAPHILHTILFSANSYGRLAALRLGIPVVIAAERNTEPARLWQVLLERLLDRVTDAYLVNCGAIARELVRRQRIAPDKIHVIPNGIDLGRLPTFSLDRHAAREAAGLDPERRLVVQVGRLTAQKDFPTFLRAAAQVMARVPDVDFVVVGEGEDRAALETLAQRLGVGPRLRFAGLRHDVPLLLAGADVLTLTSLFEGFPNVLLEAMATGAVAVTTDVGGCLELVVAEETGLVVPPRAPAAVAAAIERVLRDPALARRLALAARRRVEARFVVDVMAQRTMDTYRALVCAQGGPTAVAAA